MTHPHSPRHVILIAKGALIERRNLIKIDHIAKITVPGNWAAVGVTFVAAQRASAKDYTPYRLMPCRELVRAVRPAYISMRKLVEKLQCVKPYSLLRSWLLPSAAL